MGIIFLFYNIGSMKDPLHKLQDNPLSLSLAWVQSSFHSLYFSIHKRRESVQCYNNYNAVGEWLLKPLYSLHILKESLQKPAQKLDSTKFSVWKLQRDSAWDNFQLNSTTLRGNTFPA